MDTVIHSSARPADEAVPFMWNVLVRRLEKAEVRQRIATDWETITFGMPLTPSARLFGRRRQVRATRAGHAKNWRRLDQAFNY